ncbi:MAG: IS3 family transposase, partial [Clostridia bacterium]|nr:IS3 family transposase [Clostridia bacterium]
NLASKSSVSDRTAMVGKNEEISVCRQCDLLGIRRTKVYYHPRYGEKQLYKQKLLMLIDKIHTEYPFYGSRRMTHLLMRMGHEVNRKRIQGYMREMGITVYYPGPNLSKRNKKHKVYPYLLRNLDIESKNQVWAVDITYIPMPVGHMYLFAVIDWHTREIVDYELSNSLETTFVTRCLERAFINNGNPGIMNSDQGSQFTSREYISLLKANNIKISMDSVGRATDNALIERFFRSFKQEKLYLYEYTNVEELRALIDEYIEFYNNERPHQSLEYRTPKEFSEAA